MTIQVILGGSGSVTISIKDWEAGFDLSPASRQSFHVSPDVPNDDRSKRTG